jgi:hypothetical protein
MADLAKLVVKLEAQTARYQSELERAQRKNAQFSRNTRKSMDAVKGSFLAMAAGVVGAFATIRKGIDRQADLFDLSQRLAATSEGLSRLQYAAEQSGVSVQTLNMGLQRMVRRVAEAAAGTGEAKGALEELNISAEALNRLQPEKQFQVLADAIIAVENPADRVRLAMKLFDSEGVSLIQTMQGGSEAIRAMGSEADRLGLTVGTSAAAAAKQASDAFTRLSGVFTGAANALATQFAPELTLMAEFLTDNLPSAVGFTRKAFLALQRGAVNVALQFVKVRAAFNDLVGIRHRPISCAPVRPFCSKWWQTLGRKPLALVRPRMSLLSTVMPRSAQPMRCRTFPMRPMLLPMRPKRRQWLIGLRWKPSSVLWRRRRRR